MAKAEPKDPKEPKPKDNEDTTEDVRKLHQRIESEAGGKK